MSKRICAIYLKMVGIWLDTDDDNCYFLGKVLEDKHFWSSEYYIRSWVGLAEKEYPNGTCDLHDYVQGIWVVSWLACQLSVCLLWGDASSIMCILS